MRNIKVYLDTMDILVIWIQVRASDKNNAFNDRVKMDQIK